MVKFKIKKDSIAVSANAPSVGENQMDVDAKVEGNTLDVAFNYRFVLDFLNAVPSNEEEVTMEFSESLSPGVFKVPSLPQWLHIIMPVRTDL